MFKKPWHFLINSFLVATRSSHKKLLSLAVDHLARLVANNADAVVAAIAATFDPVLQAYMATEQNLNAVLGDYKGETQTVKQLFQELNETRLPLWEGQVFFHFPKGSEKATQLFPKGRGAFQEGTYEQRILAIKTFGDKCAATAALAPFSVQVLAFHTQISSARALQQSAGEGQTALLRNLRDAARKMVCDEMYGNLGLLMHHHRTDPLQVERYFDLGLLRQPADSGEGGKDTELTFFLKDTVKGTVISNGTAVMTRASGQQETQQTQTNGRVRFILEGLTDPEEVSFAFSAPNYEIRLEQGTILPGEDQEGEIGLNPLAPPPPAP
ncbi:MAG: hypothetical protein K9J06_02220 [Flavobacteriales bacterium]|nr:hypothetical protein [Flavobacteriales bacterium]